MFSKSDREKKIRKNCEYFLIKLNALKKVYQDKRCADKKGLIETGVGADIFYMGQSLFPFWTKKMSIGLIEQFHPKNLITNDKYTGTPDHDYSRKFSGKELLNADWLNENTDLDKFMELFKNKYARWNLVTKEENNNLKKLFQTEQMYNKPRLCYVKAGVKLKAIDNNLRKKILKRERSTIEKLLA